METTLVWIAATLLAAGIFIPYLIKFRKAQTQAIQRLEEARALGINRPLGQYPQIDRSVCIGCGSCVEACPEGDVLAVVWGTAEVINGDHCVGHGYCETACPVGALKVGLGDIKSRPDIPFLSDKNETSVPGIFIAGELSGISLIRHAIVQGRIVADEIAVRIEANPSRKDFDLVVVGAGPAGLTAALTARKHNLSCVVLDQYDLGGTIQHYPRRKLVMTQPAEIPFYGSLKRAEYSKEELLEIWQAVAESSALDIRTGQKVESVLRQDDGFQVIVADGAAFTGSYVVLAMGRRGSPRKLEVPGEDLPKVLYQLIDAQSYRDQQVLVVGGGDSAVEAAVGLARQAGNNVTISYRKPQFFRIKKKNEDAVKRLIDEKKIKTIFESQVTEIRDDSVVLSTPHEIIELPNDIIIIQAGGIPPFEMLKKIGIAFGGDSIDVKEADRRYLSSVAN